MIRFEEHLGTLERHLADADADGAILSTGPNACYLTGFAGERDRHLLGLVTPEGERTFVSGEAYVGQVRDELAIGDAAVRAVPDNTAASVVGGLLEALPDSGGTYFLDDRMRTGASHRLRAGVPDATFDLLSELVAPMRVRKDPAEVDRLREAARRTDAVSVAVRELGAEAVGMTERELAVEVRTRLAERGAVGEAFPAVVAAGPNGARPTEYRHGDREIASGEPVVLDFGGFFHRYASDQTRTVVFDGDPPPGFVEAHETVGEALEAGVSAAEPGATGGDVDAAAREVIEAAGYGDRFTTGTGHGVGLRGHEPPSISPGSTDELEPGVVFSVEPGIYVEGEWGVRLETVVALTEDGPERLNQSPETWRPL
jgi:Xaa-Pro aminopeptidase